MKVSKIMASAAWKKLPEFIRTHPIFTQITRIDKPFAMMGLRNSIEQCEVEFDGKPAYIGFSADNITGFWDLATMSMRGVCSCMHWGNTHSKHLLGSLTDPFLGMVYISDGKMTPYGSSIKRRALVRLSNNHKTNQYKLLLERPYKDTGNQDPAIYDNRDNKVNETMKVFVDFLRKRVGEKYPITSLDGRGGTLPMEYWDRLITSSSLNLLETKNWSMSDCNAYYSRPTDSSFAKFADQN
jgi:hypothetical protein